MDTIKMKNTNMGDSYWAGTGAYSAEHVNLFDELVPEEGKANTLHGELMRCTSNMNYEFFNNGNCNARDYVELSYTPHNFYYDEYEEEDEKYNYELKINECYAEYIKFIVTTINNDDIKSIMRDIEMLMVCEHVEFNDKNTHVYNSLIDQVMYFILTTENKPCA